MSNYLAAMNTSSQFDAEGEIRTAFDDLSQITQTVDFAYADVDRDVFGVTEQENPLERCEPRSAEMTCECMRKLMQWVHQDECKDLDGLACRCIVLIWVFIPIMAHTYTMTAIAARYGKKKQSIERWTRDFKKEFPDIARHHPHLKHDN